MAAITPGRIFISLVALGQAAGPYMADWSETHLFNPKWPPHAKFHNGQTMSMGVLLSAGMFYFAWRKDPAGSSDSLRTAAIFGSMYWISGLSAALYPGALAIDPEFRHRFNTDNPQIPLFSAFLGASWLAYWLG